MATGAPHRNENTTADTAQSFDVNAHQWLERHYWLAQYRFYLHSLMTSHYLVARAQPKSQEDVQQPEDLDRTARAREASTIIGYEVYSSSFLRRILAEILDIFILIIVLSVTVIGFDMRVPEDVLVQPDVYKLPDEVVEEVEEVLVRFLGSFALLAAVKTVMEVVMVTWLSTTPGKWLCGLRVLHCLKYTTNHTNVVFEARVEPGNCLPLKWSALRAVGKAAIVSCTPVIMLLMFTRTPRLKYDEWTRSAVVHVTILYRPLHSTPPALQPGAAGDRVQQ